MSAADKLPGIDGGTEQPSRPFWGHRLCCVAITFLLVPFFSLTVGFLATYCKTGAYLEFQEATWYVFAAAQVIGLQVGGYLMDTRIGRSASRWHAIPRSLTIWVAIILGLFALWRFAAIFGPPPSSGYCD